MSFAFYDTIKNKFCEFSGCQRWDNLQEFIDDYDDQSEDIERILRLIPEDFKEKI